MKIDVEILVVWIICNNFAARKFNLPVGGIKKPPEN